MSADHIFRLIAVERRRAADLFASLDEKQLATRSLCTEWTVPEIAAHLISPSEMSIPRFLLGAATSGGLHRFSVKTTKRLAQRPMTELVTTLRERADSRFEPPGTGPGAPLTDLCVHTRDAARP